MAASLLSLLSAKKNPKERAEDRSEIVLRLGRRQLESLRNEGHPYGESRVRALRRLLADGGGLPLLFPDHDVGFRYNGEGAAIFAGTRTRIGSPPRPAGAAEASSERSSHPFLGGNQGQENGFNGAVSSSSGSSPLGMLRLGGRMPHFVLRPSWDDTIESAACNDSSVPVLSTVDLPDQIRGLLLSRSDSKLPSAAHLAIFGSRVASGASRPGASLASVLVVSPLPSVAVHSGDRDEPDGGAVVPAAEAVSALWLSAAIAAQQPEVGGDSRIAATAGERGAEMGHLTPFRPLIVLTVSPPCCASIPTAATAITRTTTTTKTMSSMKHLEAYLDHRSSTSTTPVTSSEHLSAEARAAVATEGPQQSADGRSNLAIKRLDSISSDATDAAGDWKRSDTRVAVRGGQVLSMHAIDDSAGRLGKAFAAAGVEAVLLRPDGHIAWLGLRLGFGSKLGNRGERGGCGDTVPAAQELRSALDAVYSTG